MYDKINILLPVIYFHIILNVGKKVHNQIIAETLMLNHLGRVREFFHNKVIVFI